MIWLAIFLVFLGLALAVALLIVLAPPWPPLDPRRDELRARRALRPNTGNVDRREEP